MNQQLHHHSPLVSIGMPVYNGEKYIKGAIDSLLSQTFSDFELIISDNCSTDETSKICLDYASKDNRIKYLRQEVNLGPTRNFEFVLHKATGEFFMWAAHDDRWNCTFVEKLVALLINDKTCGLAFSNYIVKNLDTNSETYHSVKPSETDNFAFNFLIRTIYICPSLIYGLYRIDSIKLAKFEQFDFADVHFVSEVALKQKIKIVDEYLYIAGTKGDRKPYSLSGEKINRMQFLKRQSAMLKKYLPLPASYILFLIVCFMMAYNKVRLWRF